MKKLVLLFVAASGLTVAVFAGDNGSVQVTRAPMAIKTYPVGAPEKNPMFFEKRVYQGSCG